MKMIKNVLLCLCIVSILLPIILGFISSYMQGYYKAQIDDFSKNEQEKEKLLDQKAFWAQVGEFITLKHSIIVFVFLSLLLLIILLCKL